MQTRTTLAKPPSRESKSSPAVPPPWRTITGPAKETITRTTYLQATLTLLVYETQATAIKTQNQIGQLAPPPLWAQGNGCSGHINPVGDANTTVKHELHVSLRCRKRDHRCHYRCASAKEEERSSAPPTAISKQHHHRCSERTKLLTPTLLLKSRKPITRTYRKPRTSGGKGVVGVAKPGRHDEPSPRRKTSVHAVTILAGDRSREHQNYGMEEFGVLFPNVKNRVWNPQSRNEREKTIIGDFDWLGFNFT